MAGENKRETTRKWESGFLSRLFVRENFQLLVNKRPGGLQYICSIYVFIQLSRGKHKAESVFRLRPRSEEPIT